MAAPNSSAGSFGHKTETTAGTTVTPDLFLPFLTESWDRSQPSLESDGIRADRLVRDDEESNGANIGVEGGVTMDLPVKGASSLLTWALGSVNTTGSNPYTHAWTPGASLGSKTLQFAEPDGSGTKQPKTVAGAVCSSWEIAADEGAHVTGAFNGIAQRLTIGSRTLADVATTDTSTTIGSATGFVQADYGKDVSGTGIPAGAYITGVASDGLTATISAAATATGTGVSVVVGKALASPSYSASLSYFKMHMATLAIGGAAVPPKGFTIPGDNKNEARYFGGSKWSSSPPPTGGPPGDTGPPNLGNLSQAQCDRYFNGELFSVSLPIVSGASSLTFAGYGKFDESLVPMIGGRGRIMQDAPFHFLGSSDANALTVTGVNADSTAV